MRIVVAFALVFAMTPGLSEVAEAAVHVILHADLPHHGDEDRGECNEHTCTPLAHHCGCHMTMSAQATARATSGTSTPYVTKSSSYTITTAFGRVSEPPPLRPPIV